MRVGTLLAASALAACGAELPAGPAGDAGGEGPAPTRRWDFDADRLAALPEGFDHAYGVWAVADDMPESAPHVLKQTGAYPKEEYPRLFAGEPGLADLADLTLRARVRVDGGQLIRACGLLFRAIDEDNYYIARSQSYERNVRLYRVVDGTRQEVVTVSRRVDVRRWYTIEVRARGPEITVFWNDEPEPLFTVMDPTFSSGAIGVWSKSDSRCSFDDVTLWAAGI